MDGRSAALLIRDEEGEHPLPPRREVDDREGVEAGEEPLLVGPCRLGHEGRRELHEGRLPEGREIMGVQPAPRRG